MMLCPPYTPPGPLSALVRHLKTPVLLALFVQDFFAIYAEFGSVATLLAAILAVVGCRLVLAVGF